MLRIIVERDSKAATMRLAGKLAGPWLAEFDRTWAEVHVQQHGCGVVLDLSDVTFVAPEGRARLESVYRQGARFKTSGCFGKSIVEEIERSQT
jgi:hypothetical protein